MVVSLLQQMHPVKAFGDDGVDSGAAVLAAYQEGGARRGATRGTRVEIGEAHALGCQLIEDGSFDGTTVTAEGTVAEVTVAEVVDEQGVTRLGREAALRDVAERRTRDRRICGNLIDIRGSTINPLKRKEFGILSPIFFNSAFVRDKHTPDTWRKTLRSTSLRDLRILRFHPAFPEFHV